MEINVTLYKKDGILLIMVLVYNLILKIQNKDIICILMMELALKVIMDKIAI
jgi:hypothetical protein